MATLAYDIAVLLLRRISPHRTYAYAVVACICMLAVYWFWFDRSLLTEGRYNLRTILLIATPAFGMVATVHAMDGEARRKSLLPFLARLASAIERAMNPRLIAGAFVLTMLVHTVETAKFVWAWSEYKTAIRQLATSTESDPRSATRYLYRQRRVGPASTGCRGIRRRLICRYCRARSCTQRGSSSIRHHFFWPSCKRRNGSEADQHRTSRSRASSVFTVACTADYGFVVPCGPGLEVRFDTFGSRFRNATICHSSSSFAPASAKLGMPVMLMPF